MVQPHHRKILSDRAPRKQRSLPCNTEKNLTRLGYLSPGLKKNNTIMEKTYKAHIEANGHGIYNVYVNEDFPFGFFGEGKSVEEARNDFIAVFDGMRTQHLKRTGENVEARFEYVYDMSAILQMCKNFISFAALAEITGVNKAMLSQYACGTRKPKPEMRRRIISGIHEVGQRCLAIQ